MKVYTHSKYNYVTIAEIPLADIEKLDIAMCAQPKESLEKFYKRQERKPELLTNAGFFATSTGASVFTIVDEGKEYSVGPNNAYGFGINGGTKIEYGKYESGKYHDFVCGYPVLVVDGKPFETNTGSEISYKARRTVMALRNGTLLMIVVDDPGLTFTALKSMLVEMRCDYAINLDGGGSARMMVDGKTKVGTAWSRPVDSVLAVYLKQQILYRVQAGAFSKEANAIRLRDKIRAMNDTIGAGYAKAYVRQIDGIYKVQVGAFSKRENAERVQDDLTARGFSCYVTTV